MAPYGNPYQAGELTEFVFTLSGTSYNGLKQRYTTTEVKKNTPSELQVVFRDLLPGDYELSMNAKCPDGNLVRLSIKEPQKISGSSYTHFSASLASVTASPVCENSSIGQIKLAVSSVGPVDVVATGTPLATPKNFRLQESGQLQFLPGTWPAGKYNLQLSLAHNPCNRAPINLEVVVPEEPEIKVEPTTSEYEVPDETTGTTRKVRNVYVPLTINHNPYTDVPYSLHLVSGPGVNTPVLLQEENGSDYEGTKRVSLTGHDWQAGNYVLEVRNGCFVRQIPFRVEQSPSPRLSQFTISPSSNVGDVENKNCFRGISLTLSAGSIYDGTYGAFSENDFEFRLVNTPSGNTSQLLTPLKITSETFYDLLFFGSSDIPRDGCVMEGI